MGKGTPSKGKKNKWFPGTQIQGKKWFQLEQSGQPSRWNTLRAMRVLKWWNSFS